MSPDEQELAPLLAGGMDVVINRLPSLLGHLEPNRLTGLLLPDRRPIEGVSIGGNSSTLRVTTSQPRNFRRFADHCSPATPEKGRTVADNKTRKPDRNRINVNEDYEVRDWAHKIGASPERLNEAVAKVGPMASDVAKHLAR
jgi:hypothetical protein